MPIKMIRIDDRLIHGQVAAIWTKQSNIEQIIIVNDEVSNDKLQQSVQKLAAPSNVKVSIFSVNEFIDILNNKINIGRDTMLLLTTPLDVLEIMEKCGVILDKVIVGGMRLKEGRVQINKSVFVTKEEDEAFKKLLKMKVEVVLLAVPTDVAVNYENIRIEVK